MHQNRAYYTQDFTVFRCSAVKDKIDRLITSNVMTWFQNEVKNMLKSV